ncbi:MAG: hypothetical protein UX62_C0023G0001, partial [Microgenomates group bacterium GW2011_GWA2_46_7]
IAFPFDLKFHLAQDGNVVLHYDREGEKLKLVL